MSAHLARPLLSRLLTRVPAGLAPRLRAAASRAWASGVQIPARRVSSAEMAGNLPGFDTRPSDVYGRRKPRGGAPVNRVSRLRTLEEDRMVEAQWDDGEATRYPYVWLRDNCQCETCFHKFTKARLILMRNLDVNVKPDKVEVNAEGTQATITWKDGHESPLSAAWLRSRSFTSLQHEKRDLMFRRKPILWGGEMQDNIPSYNFDKLLESDRSIYDLLTSMEEYGMALVRGAPEKEGQVKKLADRISCMRMTAFGFIYSVKALENPPNLAWTSAPLGLHVDFVYLHQTPGVQILHCIVQTQGKGGESELVDGFRAAQQMQEEYPFYHKLLRDVPVDFTDVGSGLVPYQYLARHTTLTYNCAGQLESVKYSNQTRDSYLGVPLELVTPFYKALRLYDDYLCRPENRISLRLKPGDMVFIDNYRILHGRTGFTVTPGGPPRHLEGCYLDWDDVHSRRRILLQELKLENHLQFENN